MAYVKFLPGMTGEVLERAKDAFVRDDCTACGGDWTAMLITGIKRRFPMMYYAMPYKKFCFIEVCELINFLMASGDSDKYYYWSSHRKEIAAEIDGLYEQEGFSDAV